MFLLSYSKRPINVLLPSSTLPAVMNLKMSIDYFMFTLVILFCQLHYYYYRLLCHSLHRSVIASSCFEKFPCDQAFLLRTIVEPLRGSLTSSHFFQRVETRCYQYSVPNGTGRISLTRSIITFALFTIHNSPFT